MTYIIDSLSSLMQEAILHREKLDDVVSRMDKAISEENLKLLKVLKEERLDEETIDIPSLKREQSDIIVRKIPVLKDLINGFNKASNFRRL
ncbi:hypothetical protein JK635_11135 [Neobacillus sp. YIM B02564]|uniref:Uncharacterized protein n=1 Tax=Neobacillus paridis TaxID=2803862 RepID=A0ABS1TN54_9BACI|nr:hypothetical protein [Neobacillus paridis]MBL4952764.1 hypothetical protein [Neobacillus paridis]